MCLLLFALDEHPKYPLLVAANRDEFYQRPTTRAAFWQDAPHILAGRDLERGGTWLGMTPDGRWGAVTAFREPRRESFTTSRGHLVRDFLDGDFRPRAYAKRVLAEGHRYAGFNLLVGDVRHVVYCSNRDEDLRTVHQGMHGISNHLLDTPWPKLILARRRLGRLLSEPEAIDTDAAFRVLASQEVADDERLPDTGVGLEKERMLSSPFIASPDYGTRCSTVIVVDAGGTVRFIERTFLPTDSGVHRPDRYRETVHEFRL